MTVPPEQVGGLGDTLRALRLRAGLTGERLAVRCAMSQSKISKIETGKIIPSATDVERIVRALGAPAEVRAQLIELSRSATTEFQSTRALLRTGLDRKQAELSSLEAASTEFRLFLPAMLPALLSTPEYIAASLEHLEVTDIAKTVAWKLGRQAILSDTGKHFTFLLTETAVRWPLCPEPQMAAQLDHLASVSQLPNVRLGVIPVSAGHRRGPLNTFTVYDQCLVTAETFTGSLIMRHPRDVELHLGLFRAYADEALFADQARECLATWSAGFRKTSLSFHKLSGRDYTPFLIVNQFMPVRE